MANIEEFKGFVRENPKLATYVKDGSMTWQKFYELYDMYGKDNEVWNTYIKTDTREATEGTAAKALTAFTLADTINFIKNINLDSLQSGISNVQKVVGMVSELTNKNGTTSDTKTEYKPRPLYKHFGD